MATDMRANAAAGTSVADELCTELLEQVADLSDQVVFLQRLIPKTLFLICTESTASPLKDATPVESSHGEQGRGGPDGIRWIRAAHR